MAASAGSLYATGRSGTRYVLDLYLPDATAALWTLNASGIAASTSSTVFRAPEDLVITDVSVVTGTTAVGAQLTSSGTTIQGTSLRYANHLNTLNNRPVLNIAVPKDTQLGGIQF